MNELGGQESYYETRRRALARARRRFLAAVLKEDCGADTAPIGWRVARRESADRIGELRPAV